MQAEQFATGDRVVHTGRPEWGEAVVTNAQWVMQRGERCQRLTLRFDRAGLKTLSPAIAALAHADRIAAPAASVAAKGSATWLDDLERGDPAEAMARLPESATDPFASLERRLTETLRLYRFSASGGSLLDWAAAQTRLPDPLSRFSRHELEQFFDRFAHVRDQHLRSLGAEARRSAPEMLRAVAADAPPSALRVLNDRR